jgi:tRNA threonylcarbamoyladenosine biosynthesis protein TsaB
LNVLAFDTAHAPGIALCRGEKTLASRTLEAKSRQTETLHAQIAALLEAAGWKPSNVEAIAVGLGPGSFTGLRIGIAAAAAWGWSAKIPVYGFSRLEAVGRIRLSENPAAPSVWVRENAGRSNRYEARYARAASGGVRVLVAPRLAPAGSSPFEAVPDAGRVAAELARMALEKKRRPIDPFRLRPQYLYPKDCNVTLPK